MWIKNSDTGKWQKPDVKLSKEKFDSLKEDLKKLRYYSKCKDGIGYLTTNSLSDVYNITNFFDPKDSWYLSSGSSIYATPSNGNKLISTQSISEWNSEISEYAFTIRNLYNPNRVVDTIINNYKEVDLVTNEKIDNLTDIKNDLFVDGYRVLNGHRILVKDQITYEVYTPQINYTWNGNWALGSGDWYQDSTGQLWSISSGQYQLDHSSNLQSRKLNLNFEGTKSTILSFTAYVDQSMEILLLADDDIVLYSTTITSGSVSFSQQIDTDRNASKLSITSKNTTFGGTTRIVSMNVGLLIGPDNYFQHEYFQATQSTDTYYYYNSENGIYKFNNNKLVRETDLLSYTYSTNYSVTSKIGTNNKDKQFHLKRLKSGLYPSDSNQSPYNRFSFFEGHNWIVRNKNQYNNSLDLNYYDILQTITQSLVVDSMSYSIPQRTIYIGEYGSILNYQNDKLNIIYNRFKNKLRSICETTDFYWICGDSGILLKIDKITFEIEKISLDVVFNLNSIDFLNSNKGFIVGDYNTILWTDNGGKSWVKLNIPTLDDEMFNTVKYYSLDTVFIGGNRGFLLKIGLSGDEWNVTKINLIKKTESDGDYNIFDNVNQIIPVSFNNQIPWNLVIDNNGVTQSTITNKEILMVVGDNQLISIIDINGFNIYNQSMFINSEIIGNINSISNYGSTFSISTSDNVYQFNINNYNIVGTSSNTLSSNIQMTKILNVGSNKIKHSYGDFNLCGDNTQVLKVKDLSSIKIPSNKIQFLYSDVGEDEYIDFNLPTGKRRFIFEVDHFYPNVPYGFIRSGGYYLNTIKDYLINEVIPVLSNDDVLSTSYSVRLDSDDTIIIEANGYDYGYNFSMYSSTSNIVVTSSVTASIVTIDLITEEFKSKVKSKYLFLDYDIASKMYFFDDDLTYRLPNDFKIYGYNGLSMTLSNTQSISINNVNGENNWITYYKDENKQFKLGDTISDSSKVLFNTTFTKVSNNDITINISSDITNTKSDIFNLIPFEFDSVSSISGPSVSKSMYLWDDIMIFNISATALGNVISGDILKMDSTVVTDTFMVNRVETFSGRKYVYIKSDFNQSIINNLLSIGTPSNISLTNINRFNNSSNLQSNFISHPLSYGYNLESSDYTLKLSPKLTNYTAYYNMQTNVIANYTLINLPTINTTYSISSTSSNTNMLYNDSFISFGFKSNYNILDYLYNIDPITFTSSKTFNILPKYYNINVVSSSTQSGVTLGYMTIGTYSANILKKKGEWTFNENEIAFTSDLKFEWETFLLSTYVDINLKGRLDGNDTPQSNLLVEKLLIIGKYYSPIDGGRWVIQFNKRISKKGDNRSTIVDILSRNRLDQISSDLNELNNIQSNQRTKILQSTSFTNYESELLNRFYTDSYAKALLSDSDIKSKLTSLSYIDNKGQLSVSTINNKSTKKGNIVSVTVFGTYSVFYTDADYNLNKGDSIILDMNYGTYSNYQMDGYKLISDSSYNSFTINESYTSVPGNIVATVSTQPNLSWSATTFPPNPVLTVDAGRLKVVTNGSGRGIEFSVNTTPGAQYVWSFSGEAITNHANAYVFRQFLNTSLSSATVSVGTGGYQMFFTAQDNVSRLTIVSSLVSGTQTFYINTPFDTSVVHQLITITSSILNIDGEFTQWVSDPNLNYTPIDIIDVGIDKNIKKSILIDNENISITDNMWSLNNIDFNRYRFRLVDNLNLQIVALKYPWLLEAEIEDAIIGHNGTQSIWYNGTWECGRWFDGIWVSGNWMGGEWYDGTWYSFNIKDNYTDIIVDKNYSDINASKWYSGTWYSGTRHNGKWYNGSWYGGTWIDGTWYSGRWHDGLWKNGSFIGGDWVRGTWENGTFNSNYSNSYWIDGTWYGGDFENGTWYSGIFTEYKNNKSRFGTKSSNSKRSLWYGGKFNMGEFHSSLNLDTDGKSLPSLSNKYSTWYTGEWSNGSWYGGTCYIINWQLGSWYSGIVKPLNIESIIGTGSNAKFQLDGEWRFNIGDNIFMIDAYTSSNLTTPYLVGLPINGKVESIEFDYENSKTFINTSFGATSTSNPNLIIAPHFSSVSWKNGIWYNGIFNGTWESGIWYNGIFESGTWTPDQTN